MLLSAAQIMRAPKSQQATLVLTSGLQTRRNTNPGAGERLGFLLISSLEAADCGRMPLNKPWAISSFLVKDD